MVKSLLLAFPSPPHPPVAPIPMSDFETPEKTPAPSAPDDDHAVPRSALRRIFRALFPSAPKDPIARVRHRFIGAACILAIAVLLWELGDDLPPPDVSGGGLVNTRFPNENFVQIHTEPPQSQLQDIPPPRLPAHSADFASDSPDSPDSVAPADQPPPSQAENPDAETPDDDSQAPPPVADSNAPPEPARDESADSIPDNQFQVGAFRDSEGAEQMARWLRGDGFDAAVQKGQDGIFRVLSGANPKHLAALGYISQNAAGSDSENPPPEPPEAEDRQPSPFVVQLGAFSDEARARKMTARLREQKFSARIEPVRRGGETLFRVRIVGLADRDSAEAVRRRLAAIGHGAAQTIDTR